MFSGHISEVTSKEKVSRIKIVLFGAYGVLSTFYAKQTNLLNKRIHYSICDSCALLAKLLQQIIGPHKLKITLKYCGQLSVCGAIDTCIFDFERCHSWVSETAWIQKQSNSGKITTFCGKYKN